MSATLARTPRQPLAEVHILNDHHGDADPDGGARLAWAEVQALVEDFELEAASYLRTLTTSRTTALASLARHFSDSLASLDPRVRDMPLARFVHDFASDAATALRGVVEDDLRAKNNGSGARDGRDGNDVSALMSARKRKRVLPLSPRQDGHDDDPDSNPFLAPNASAVKHKKLRQANSAADLKGKGKAPASASASASARKGGDGAATGGTARKTRLRLRPSTNASTSSSSAHANFVFRSSSAAAVPPTPLTRARQPRRGESIVLRSLNDSPLGEFVASSLVEHSDPRSPDSDADEGEGEAGWDLVGEHEASRVEHLTPSRRLGGGRSSPTEKKAPTATANSKPGPAPAPVAAAGGVRPPSTNDFAVPLPPDAPSFDALKAKWVDELRAKLREQAAGEAERKRVEDVLVSLLKGI